MSNETSSYIAFAKKQANVGVHTPRRASLPPSWDDTDLLLPSTDDENSNKDSSAVEGEAAAAAAYMTSPSRHHHHHDRNKSRSMSGDYSSLRASLLAQNSNLASVNQKMAEHLKSMLENVRRKTGTPMADAPDTVQLEAYRTLTTVPPFSYLPNQEIRALVKDLHLLEYQDGEVIVQQGQDQNQSDRDVYVLAKKRVVLVRLNLADGMISSSTNSTDSISNSGSSTPSVDSSLIGRSSAKFVGYLDAPAMFGEWATLFDGVRDFQVIAGGSQVVVYRMSGERFESLLAHHHAFRLKLALGLRSSGIFADIEAFVAMMRRAVSHDGEDKFDMPAILACYRRMVPAIHANLHSSLLDLEGWTYAVRRLPDSITSTYTYLLSNHVPMPFMHPHFRLQDVFVKTVARRRQAFALDHGKLLVVMREKFSDVLDFVSLLCCHLHESAKLRTKLVRPSALDVIHRCLWAPERRLEPSFPLGDRKLLYHRCQSSTYATASIAEQKQALAQLPLTAEEQQGLQALWPKDFLYRIWDIICLHENIQVRSDLTAAAVDATDRWAERIRRAVLDLLAANRTQPGSAGEEPSDLCLRTEIVTHIISSNTTSVRNLLSPYLLQRKAEIYEWGSKAHPEIMGHNVLSDSDKFCALCNAYMKHHGQKAIQEQEEVDGACFKTLRSTELTGIQVELLDLDALDAVYAKLNIAPDPFLASCFPDYDPETKSWKEPKNLCGSKQARLLVNIDYAFGKQAEQLISSLSLLFGKSVASVGVMGKAGGLQGRRGDIIVADYLVFQDGDEQTLIDNTGVDREALHTLSQREVHSGGVLTVLGTLLQDSRLLNFYKKLYGCVSLEMEGSFYARELRRYKKAGLLNDDVNLRFLYYISDTPLSQDQTETLSSDMSLAEVIPPQYAVTRALLKPVLEVRCDNGAMYL